MPTTIINKFWLLCCLPFSPRGSRQHCSPPSSLHTNTLTKQIHRHTISATFLAFCRMRNSPESTSRTRPSENPVFFFCRDITSNISSPHVESAPPCERWKGKKSSVKAPSFFIHETRGGGEKRWGNDIVHIFFLLDFIRCHKIKLLFLHSYGGGQAERGKRQNDRRAPATIF